VPSPDDAAARALPSDPVRIGWGTLVSYSVPLVPVYVLYMALTVVYMNFATDVLAIAPGVIGAIFFVSKIWDAVSDPVIGFLSDRTRSRFGRRKVWMYASVIPMVVTTIMLWTPDARLDGPVLALWSLVSVLGFYTAFTIFVVPQMALGVELSPSPHERSRIFGGRQTALTLGMLGAFLVATPLIVGHPEARQNAAAFAWIMALLLGVTILVTTRALPVERGGYAGRGATNPLAATRDVLRNPHARLLLFVYFIEVFGIGATSAMTPFLLKYVTKAADYVGLVFLFYTAPALLSIPFWVWMGQRH
jgi:GPH family glycoside/pentoside/hexuronide:cation symporter